MGWEGGNGNPLQGSCLGNSMVRGAQQTSVHGIAKSWTQLSNLNNMIKTTPLNSETKVPQNISQWGIWSIFILGQSAFKCLGKTIQKKKKNPWDIPSSYLGFFFNFCTF